MSGAVSGRPKSAAAARRVGVHVQLTIGGDGAITAATARGVSPEVASCIAEAAGTLQFPAPAGARAATCTVVIDLQTTRRRRR